MAYRTNITPRTHTYIQHLFIVLHISALKILRDASLLFLYVQVFERFLKILSQNTKAVGFRQPFFI